jgi:hypothetical protein
MDGLKDTSSTEKVPIGHAEGRGLFGPPTEMEEVRLAQDPSIGKGAGVKMGV